MAAKKKTAPKRKGAPKRKPANADTGATTGGIYDPDLGKPVRPLDGPREPNRGPSLG